MQMQYTCARQVHDTTKKLTSYHPLLCTIRGLIIGAQMAGASVANTAQWATISIATVSKSEFRPMGRTSNSVGNCGQKRTFSECDAHALGPIRTHCVCVA